MPADALASVLARGTEPATATVLESVPEPSLGEVLAGRYRSSWFLDCEKCGILARVPSSRQQVHPRCKACGPNRDANRKRKKKPRPEAEQFAFI